MCNFATSPDNLRSEGKPSEMFAPGARHCLGRYSVAGSSCNSQPVEVLVTFTSLQGTMGSGDVLVQVLVVLRGVQYYHACGGLPR